MGLSFPIVETKVVVINDFIKGLTSFVCCPASPQNVVAIEISYQYIWFRELIY